MNSPTLANETLTLLKLRAVTVTLEQGNILDAEVDAIVCPANNFLDMNGGLSASIRRRVGPWVERDAVRNGIIDLGGAVVTEVPSQLPRGPDVRPVKFRYVIHAPTVPRPMDSATQTSVKLAARVALECATILGIQSLAIPAMGTGTGVLSFNISADCILQELARAIRLGMGQLRRVVIVAFEPEFFEAVRQEQFLLSIS